jgi:hypothetical protein
MVLNSDFDPIEENCGMKNNLGRKLSERALANDQSSSLTVAYTSSE